MSRSPSLRMLMSLLALVLGACLVAAPAQANPRSPDPELVQPAVASGRATAGSARSAPAVIDSDVYAYVSSPSARIYFVVSGRLKLALKSGSTTKYSGSLVDYVGNKSYKASADASNPATPTLTFKSKNGTFAFTMNASFGGTSYTGTGSTVPSKLKVPADQVYFNASTHTTRSASFSLTLTDRVGAISNPLEYAGTLTLVYDANGRISGGQITVSNSKGKNVTHPLTSSGFYSADYFYTVAKVDKTSFGISATSGLTGFSGFAFSGSGSKVTQWLVSATA